MTKASAALRSIFLLTFLLPLSFNALADSSALPMVLESDDPEKPLEIILDKAWTGKDVQAKAGEWSNLGLGDFKVDTSKGPVTLVVDYAATRPNDEDGEAIIDIGIECAQENSGDPCSIPIGDSVIGIRTAFMGESAININGTPQAVWVGRESHSYFLPAGTANVALTLNSRNNLEPKAIRARLFYGDYDRSSLPGQASRSGIFKKIGIAVFLGLIGFFWWMSRK